MNQDMIQSNAIVQANDGLCVRRVWIKGNHHFVRYRFQRGGGFTDNRYPTDTGMMGGRRHVQVQYTVGYQHTRKGQYQGGIVRFNEKVQATFDGYSLEQNIENPLACFNRRTVFSKPKFVVIGMDGIDPVR